MAGRLLLARVRFVQPRTAFAVAQAPRILATFPDPDERLTAFNQLARERLTVDGQPQSEVQKLDPRVVQTVRETIALCEGLAVASWHEHARVEQTFGVTVEPYLVEAAADLPIPNVVRDEVRDAIVVWAPLVRAVDLALVTHAFDELARPVFVVCAGGKAPPVRAAFVGPADAARVLAQAAVIVDASLEHPGNALELAKVGAPLVVSLATGAYERLDDVGIFLPWDRADVLRAVQSALGAGPPRPRRAPLPAVSAAPPPEPAVDDGPLVSIVVRTYNRPEYLLRALQSLERQTYPNLEIVVVSDAGTDVSQIVATVERARLIVHESNRGAIASANTGLRESRGEFVGLLDDDDILFPDHVATIVAALLRSGADVAHADTLSAFYDPSVSDDVPYGYALFLNKPGEPSDLKIADGIGPMAALFRRRIALDLGGYDETLRHAEDWELWIRLAERCDFVHVPRVTALYSIRNDGTNMMSYNAAGFAESVMQIAEKHPLPDRPALAAVRAETIERFVASGAEARFPQPAFERR